MQYIQQQNELIQSLRERMKNYEENLDADDGIPKEREVGHRLYDFISSANHPPRLSSNGSSMTKPVNSASSDQPGTIFKAAGRVPPTSPCHGTGTEPRWQMPRRGGWQSREVLLPASRPRVSAVYRTSHLFFFFVFLFLFLFFFSWTISPLHRYGPRSIEFFWMILCRYFGTFRGNRGLLLVYPARLLRYLELLAASPNVRTQTAKLYIGKLSCQRHAVFIALCLKYTWTWNGNWNIPHP